MFGSKSGEEWHAVDQMMCYCNDRRGEGALDQTQGSVVKPGEREDGDQKKELVYW